MSGISSNITYQGCRNNFNFMLTFIFQRFGFIYTSLCLRITLGMRVEII